MKTLRVTAGVAGLALMGVGVSLLMDVRDLRGVLVWLVVGKFRGSRRRPAG